VQAAHNPAELAGLITDGDLRRTLQRHAPEEWEQITAAGIATADPITVQPQELAAMALKLMEKNRRKSISVLPVINSYNGRAFVGLLRLHDLINAGFSIESPSA
jgi:arabinose-5-phosphate isomerase